MFPQIEILSRCCLLLYICYRFMDYALPIFVCIFAYRSICLSSPWSRGGGSGVWPVARDQCRPACPRRDLPRLGVERRRPQNLFCLRGVMGAPQGAPLNQPATARCGERGRTGSPLRRLRAVWSRMHVLRSLVILDALQKTGSYRRQHLNTYKRVSMLFNFLT